MAIESATLEHLASEGLRLVALQHRLAAELLELHALERQREASEKAIERAVDAADREHKETKFAELDDQVVSKRDEVRVTTEALLGLPFERIEDANL